MNLKKKNRERGFGEIFPGAFPSHTDFGYLVTTHGRGARRCCPNGPQREGGTFWAHHGGAEVALPAHGSPHTVILPLRENENPTLTF